MKENIIAILSIYLIRPQQRRIFALSAYFQSTCNAALLCNDNVREYCNIMRRLRNISGRLIKIGIYNILYHDIYGYTLDRRNVTHYYKNIDYYFNIRKYKKANFTSIVLRYNNIKLYEITTNYDMNTINYYYTNTQKYKWNTNRELSFTFNINKFFITICNENILIHDGLGNYRIINKN
jgi:hypothetical protein